MAQQADELSRNHAALRERVAPLSVLPEVAYIRWWQPVFDLLTPTVMVALGAIYAPSLAFGAWLVRESARSRR